MEQNAQFDHRPVEIQPSAEMCIKQDALLRLLLSNFLTVLSAVHADNQMQAEDQIFCHGTIASCKRRRVFDHSAGQQLP